METNYSEYRQLTPVRIGLISPSTSTSINIVQLLPQMANMRNAAKAGKRHHPQLLYGLRNDDRELTNDNNVHDNRAGFAEPPHDITPVDAASE